MFVKFNYKYIANSVTPLPVLSFS